MAFNITTIPLNFEQINGGMNSCLILDTSKSFEYVDGKRTDNQLGIRYDCVLPNNKFEKISIKVLGETEPSISREEIDSNAGSVEVVITGFEGKLYRDRFGNFDISCTATAVTKQSEAEKPRLRTTLASRVAENSSTE